MIADEDVHVAPGRLRFALETHEQVHGVTRPRSAIEEVPDDDEPCIAAGPCEVGVQNPDVLQRRDHCVIGAVHVGDRDDASVSVDAPVVCVGAGNDEQDEAEQ